MLVARRIEQTPASILYTLYSDQRVVCKCMIKMHIALFV